MIRQEMAHVKIVVKETLYSEIYCSHKRVRKSRQHCKGSEEGKNYIT